MFFIHRDFDLDFQALVIKLKHLSLDRPVDIGRLVHVSLVCMYKVNSLHVEIYCLNFGSVYDNMDVIVLPNSSCAEPHGMAWATSFALFRCLGT